MSSSSSPRRKLAQELEQAWRKDAVPALKIAGRVFLGAMFGPAMEAGRQVAEESKRRSRHKAEQKIIDAVFIDEEDGSPRARERRR